MIKKKQTNASLKPRGTTLTQAELASVTGGDPGTTRIKETVVAD